MKLYIYKLMHKLEVTEMEANEVHGLIRPVEGHLPTPKGFITVAEIGKVKIGGWGYEMPYVILLEPNMEKAKQILIEEYIEKKIEAYKNNIVRMEEKRKKILEAEG